LATLLCKAEYSSIVKLLPARAPADRPTLAPWIASAVERLSDGDPRPPPLQPDDLTRSARDAGAIRSTPRTPAGAPSRTHILARAGDGRHRRLAQRRRGRHLGSGERRRDRAWLDAVRDPKQAARAGVRCVSTKRTRRTVTGRAAAVTLVIAEPIC
jgi:hypothetical protein